MRLNNPGSIAAETKAAFFNGFFAEFCKVPFGSMSKRDLECLLLKLLCDHALIDTAPNRAAANALGINETRLKSYLVDTRYKYREDSLDASIEKIIAALREGKTLKLEPEKDGAVSFVLEDPVLRLDLAQALKNIGHYADGAFNTEVVKIKNYALLALLLQRRGDDKTLYKAIAEKAGEHEKELARYLSANTTWLERGKKVFEYVKGHPLELLQTALGIAAL